MSQGHIRNATGNSFFAWDGEVLVVNILGKPSAGKNAIGKPKGTQLKVSVTAAPLAGKATNHTHGALSGAAVRRGRGRHRGGVRARERQQAAAHPGAEKTAGRVFAASPVNHYFIDSCSRMSLLRQGPI